MKAAYAVGSLMSAISVLTGIIACGRPGYVHPAFADNGNQASISALPGASDPAGTQALPQVPAAAPLVQSAIKPTYRIDAGASVASDDSTGNLWSEDRYFQGGTATAGDLIFNFSGDVVHRTQRLGNFSYQIPVEPGVYMIRLHFAEQSPVSVTLSQRLFNVRIEDQPVLTNFDILASAGLQLYAAVMREFRVTVNDRLLIIDFISVSLDASIDGIEVIPLN